MPDIMERCSNSSKFTDLFNFLEDGKNENDIEDNNNNKTDVNLSKKCKGKN
jgi:hypothetical protein